ncbi:MAG: hypothetical protein ABMB14_06265 [Myxococcota bacterium]
MYELGLSLSLAADPFLFGAGGSTLASTGPSRSSVAVEVPSDDVTGTLEPPEWPSPELWDREGLSMSFTVEGELGSLDLAWWAANDDADGARAAGTGTGTGTASTGTAEPSGMWESIGYVQGLIRRQSVARGGIP